MSNFSKTCRRCSLYSVNFSFGTFSKRLDVSIESTENGARLSLYRGIGMFDIDKSGCRKLVICADKNLIAFQIWNFFKKFRN
jgi:hypothetical protein